MSSSNPSESAPGNPKVTRDRLWREMLPRMVGKYHETRGEVKKSDVTEAWKLVRSTDGARNERAWAILHEHYAPAVAQFAEVVMGPNHPGRGSEDIAQSVFRLIIRQVDAGKTWLKEGGVDRESLMLQFAWVTFLRSRNELRSQHALKRAGERREADLPADDGLSPTERKVDPTWKAAWDANLNLTRAEVVNRLATSDYADDLIILFRWMMLGNDNVAEAAREVQLANGKSMSEATAKRRMDSVMAVLKETMGAAWASLEEAWTHEAEERLAKRQAKASKKIAGAEEDQCHEP